MSDDKIKCEIDNAMVHSIAQHIKANHSDWTLDRYKAEFPGAPLLSQKAIAMIKEQQKRKESDALVAASVKKNEAEENKGVQKLVVSSTDATKQHFHVVFEIPEEIETLVSGAKVKQKNPDILNARDEYISISVFSDKNKHEFVPDVDTNYVFSADLTKYVIIGMELNYPIYLWGYHGTGKTTILEQVCARTNRPFIRVQHTVNTEESNIIGQYLVRDGATYFQPGPLTNAMKYGWVYCADEYDFGLPSVLSVYQPVLEGKPLIIKDAPPEWHVVRPHPNFRFVATGNTNGAGDDTGLYQGTQIQNSANYSRFKIVCQVNYMEPAIERAILIRQSKIPEQTAGQFVELATKIREAFAAGKISNTISPRELITIGCLGRTMGGGLKGKWPVAFQIGFLNRLNKQDEMVVKELLNRIIA